MLLSSASHNELPPLELIWADAAYAGAFAPQLEAEQGCALTIGGSASDRHRYRQLWRYGSKEKLAECVFGPAETPPRPAGR
jgi:hypothetical protein